MGKDQGKVGEARLKPDVRQSHWLRRSAVRVGLRRVPSLAGRNHGANIRGPVLPWRPANSRNLPLPSRKYEFGDLLGLCELRHTCIAVGTDGAVLNTTDGWQSHQLQLLQPSGPDPLESVACSSVTNCLAVGQFTVATSADGGIRGLPSPH
jgi:hypothetical protein